MENLRILRKQRGITQRQLANDLNITQQSVYKYENNLSKPNMEILQIMSDYFHVSIDDLVDDSLVELYCYTKPKSKQVMLSEEEAGLIAKFRHLSQSERKTFKKMIDSIYESRNYILH